MAHYNLAVAFYYVKDFAAAKKAADKAAGLGYPVAPQFIAAINSEL